MNIIENVWGQLARKVYKDGKHYDNAFHPCTPNQLVYSIVACWLGIEMSYIKTLYESIPRRLISVIEKREVLLSINSYSVTFQCAGMFKISWSFINCTVSFKIKTSYGVRFTFLSNLWFVLAISYMNSIASCRLGLFSVRRSHFSTSSFIPYPGGLSDSRKKVVLRKIE